VLADAGYGLSAPFRQGLSVAVVARAQQGERMRRIGKNVAIEYRDAEEKLAGEKALIEFLDRLGREEGNVL
jgi:hypothetical protein